MDISVIVATYNQQERLRLVLSGLENQSISSDHFEILVVDDGSTDGTGAMLKSLKMQNLGVESFQTNQGRCLARNRGIERAHGSLVVFLDGDALPAPDLLQRYLEAYKENGQKSVFCGYQYVLPDLEYFQNPQTGFLLDISLPYSLRRRLALRRDKMIVTEDMVCNDFSSIMKKAVEGGYPFESVRTMQREFLDLYETVEEPALGWIGLYPHNMAIPLKLLEKVGGFDDTIPFCEGWELGYRLRAAGGRFISVQASSYHLYHHHHFSDPEKAKAEGVKRYAAVEYMARKHSDALVRLVHFWWAHLWPNPFFPEESVIDSLIEFDHIYRTISETDKKEYQEILDALPQFDLDTEPSIHYKFSRAESAVSERVEQQDDPEKLSENPCRTASRGGQATRIHGVFRGRDALDPSRLGQDRDRNHSFQTASEEWKTILASADEHWQNGRLESALSQIELAKEVNHRQSGTTIGLANILISQGKVYELKGELDKANQCYDKAISIFSQTGGDESTRKLAVGYTCKGFIMQLRDNFDEATDLYVKAQNLNKEINCQEGYALALGNLGTVHILKGDLDSAEKFYEESIAIYKEIGDSAGIADQYSSLANLRKIQGRIYEARTILEQAIEIDKDIDRKEGLALDYGLFSSLHLLMGNTEEALEYGQAALETNQSLADEKGKAYSYSTLADVHFYRGDFSLAESYLHRSIGLFERMGMSANAIDRYLPLGKLYAHSKKFDKAKEVLSDYLRLTSSSTNQQTIAAARTTLSLIYIQCGQYEDAYQEQKNALGIYEDEKDKKGIAYGLASLGEIHQLREQWDKAKSHYSKSLSICKEIGDELGQGLAYMGMGDVAAKEELKEKAVALWMIASEIFVRINMCNYADRVKKKIKTIQGREL